MRKERYMYIKSGHGIGSSTLQTLDEALSSTETAQTQFTLGQWLL